jgi:hypothetical protein
MAVAPSIAISARDAENFGQRHARRPEMDVGHGHLQRGER